jgi:hypothetical protein
MRKSITWNLLALSLALPSGACARLSNGMPPTLARPPAASCRIEALARTNRYRRDDGDHFVFFYWTEQAGRAAIEYVVPASAALPREVRTYDRTEGAHYQVDVVDGGAWAVRGRPSAVRSCAAPEAVAANHARLP